MTYREALAAARKTRALLRLQQVLALTGLSRSVLYKLTAEGNFPASIRLSGRAVAWDSLAVEAWIESRIAASVYPEVSMHAINMAGGLGPAPSEIDKAFHTLRIRLTLAGCTLSRTDASDGARAYFVSGWGMVSELRDLDAVEAFAKQVEGTEHG